MKSNKFNIKDNISSSNDINNISKKYSVHRNKTAYADKTKINTINTINNINTIK